MFGGLDDVDCAAGSCGLGSIVGKTARSVHASWTDASAPGGAGTSSRIRAALSRHDRDVHALLAVSAAVLLLAIVCFVATRRRAFQSPPNAFSCVYPR